MKLDLKIYPAEILRQNAAEVRSPLSAGVQKFIRDMIDTVRAAEGVGLAAPQVGKSERIIVVNLEHLGLPAFALINPLVTDASRKKELSEEGCLSIPGVFGMVSRPEKIRFQGTGINGKKIEADAEGLLARVIQHEIDHINGVLIIDKIKKYTKGKELIK